MVIRSLGVTVGRMRTVRPSGSQASQEKQNRTTKGTSSFWEEEKTYQRKHMEKGGR
jgi:hypothetical protein